MTVKQKIQQNPMVSSVAGILFIVALVMGTIKAVQDIDGLIMTEAEANVAHTAIDQRALTISNNLKIEATAGKCRWLSDKVDRLRYEIYTLERDNASADFIQSKKSELINVERDFNALGCAAVLA